MKTPQKPILNRMFECNFCSGYGTIISAEVYPNNVERIEICPVCNGTCKVSGTLWQIIDKSLNGTEGSGKRWDEYVKKLKEDTNDELGNLDKSSIDDYTEEEE